MDNVAGNIADDQELLVMDGYDDCIVGVVEYRGETLVVYDRVKILNRLVSDGMTEEEAVEYHDFNQAGAYMGEGTPVFLDKP